MSLSAPISHTPTLPRLPEADHVLFSLYASLRLDLHALADQSGRGLAELTAWAAAPEIRLWVETYREIAGQSLITTAMTALVETMKATENLIEKRRAATAIIRAHHTPRRNTASPSPSFPEKGAGRGSAALGTASVSTSPTQTPRTTAPTSPTANSIAPFPVHAPPTSPSAPAPPIHPSTYSPIPIPALTQVPFNHTASTRDLTSPPGRISRLTSAAGLAGPAP